jgi:hypothetical protein
MAKRPPLSFPELEPKGRRAILRSAEEVAAEEQMLETRQAGDQSFHLSSMTEFQQTTMPSSQNTGSRAGYPKVTYRLNPEAVDAIEDLKRILRRQFGIKASLEEIAEAAIMAAHQDLLENQLSSNLANNLAGKPAIQQTRAPSRG